MAALCLLLKKTFDTLWCRWLLDLFRTLTDLDNKLAMLPNRSETARLEATIDLIHSILSLWRQLTSTSFYFLVMKNLSSNHVNPFIWSFLPTCEASSPGTAKPRGLLNSLAGAGQVTPNKEWPEQGSARVLNKLWYMYTWYMSSSLALTTLI